MDNLLNNSTFCPIISILGAGNVATHLAVAFARRGFPIASIYSRTMDSAEALARILENEGYKTFCTNRLEQLQQADVYVVSLKDDAIPRVVASWPKGCKGGVVLHTAGSVNVEVLAGACEHYGVLYPMQTFSKYKPLDYKKITCFVEGNDETAESVATAMGTSVFGNCVKLSSADRRHLHLAAVFSCNFANHMFALGAEILENHGIDPACMIPLIDETASKLHSAAPHMAQTGPAVRNDQSVIGHHLEMLQDNPELQNIYKLLTESILRRFHS